MKTLIPHHPSRPRARRPAFRPALQPLEPRIALSGLGFGAFHLAHPAADVSRPSPPGSAGGAMHRVGKGPLSATTPTVHLMPTFHARPGHAGAGRAIRDAGVSATSDSLAVTAAQVSYFDITASGDALLPNGGILANTPFSITVVAKDLDGNTVTGYLGTIKFTATDLHYKLVKAAKLPAPYTFTAADNGSHTFDGVVLKSDGKLMLGADFVYIQVTDTITGLLTQTSFWVYRN